MQGVTTLYNGKQKLYSLLMIVALLWLTVSAPFINAQEKAAKQTIEKGFADGEDADTSDTTNPEESTERGVNTLQEEYLHTAHTIEHHFLTLTTYYKCHSSDLYFAYHPDTLSPPPDFFVA